MARETPFVARTRRRWAIARGRTWRSLPRCAPRAKTVFLHLPKCGGTSLSEALYATVPLYQRIGVIDAVSTRRAASVLHFGKDDPFLCHEDRDTGQRVFDLREAMLLQHMAWDTMLIHGHVLWSPAAFAHFGAEYKYVTMMRDPLARTLSNFRMAQRNGVITGGLEAYLQSDVARRQSQVFLRYLAGRNDIAEAEIPDAIDLAKARLGHFALIGFLERSERFLQRYKEIFGVSLLLSQLNAAPERRPDYPAPLLKRLEALCAADREIYDHARTLE